MPFLWCHLGCNSPLDVLLLQLGGNDYLHFYMPSTSIVWLGRLSFLRGVLRGDVLRTLAMWTLEAKGEQGFWLHGDTIGGGERDGFGTQKFPAKWHSSSTTVEYTYWTGDMCG